MRRRRHVFVSYVREDARVVDRLARDLRRHGIEVWLDRDSLKAGERWRDAIRDAIQNGWLFVACFSKAYMRRSKSHMNEELTLAIDELRQRPTTRVWFVPVSLADGSIPARSIGGGETLRDLQWVDLSSSWENGISRIVAVASKGNHRITSALGEPLPVAPGSDVRTVTLSLEIHRSELVMESAAVPVEVVKWVDQQRLIVDEVARRYNAYVGTFNNHGGEMCFPIIDETRMQVGVSAAIGAAFVLQHAMILHVQKVKHYLLFDSPRIGAAIGIDVAQAHWGVGRGNNVITIGRGPVTAARLSGNAATGVIMLSNIAYRCAPAQDRRRFKPIIVELKAIGSVQLWAATVNPTSRNIAGVTAREIVAEVYGTALSPRSRRKRS